MIPESPATAFLEKRFMRLIYKPLLVIMEGPMSIAVLAFKDDAELLVACLNGNIQAREQLPNRVFPQLLKPARRIAPDLDPDLNEEIVQQLGEILLRKQPSSFDPSRGTVDNYLRLVLRQAAREVRSSYAPPGERTRLQKDSAGEIIKQRHVPSLSVVYEVDRSDTSTQNSLREVTPDETDQICGRLDAERLLMLARNTAPAPVFHALELIYRKDMLFQEAAKAVGMTRFRLRRSIDRWRDQQGLSRTA